MNGQAYDFDKAARQRKLRSDMTRWAVIGGIVLAVLILALVIWKLTVGRRRYRYGRSVGRRGRGGGYRGRRR